MLSTLLFAGLVVRTTNAAFYYPDVQTSLLEHILVDNWGAYASNFSSAITPCTRYVTQQGDVALNSGRTTAAQSLRVLFHDMVTANVTAGTGGVDASIGFEIARSENSGSAFNDSFTFWQPFVNEAVSMSDLVALGTVVTNNLCGGNTMQYRAGRIDATSAGVTTGEPAPDTDLDTTLTFFERAGFDKTDAIAFTACGHTLGSVHHGGFPNVVDNTTVTPNNTNGGVNFDSTRGVFDPLVVEEYVSGTGQRGGALVTTANVSQQSDLRLYESDGNVTMKSLFAQGAGFLDTCVDLMGRAIDTVPSNVQLGSTISPMSAKPINVTYDFGSNGNLTLSGKIRILTATGKQAPQSLTIGISNHETRLTSEVATGSSKAYGTTSYFPFSLTGPSVVNAKSFSFTGSGVDSQSYTIQSQTFVVPSMTTVSGQSVNATVATTSSQQCSDFTLQIAAPATQPGTLAPKIIESRMSLSAGGNGTGGYVLCAGQYGLGFVPTGGVSIKVRSGSTVIDQLMVNAGNAGW